MKTKIVSLCIIFLYINARADLQVTANEENIPLYEIFELAIISDSLVEKPFLFPRVAAMVTYPDGFTTTVYGYYDGKQTWRIRFMPNQLGTYHVDWSFAEKNGSTTFVSIPKTNSKSHGHLYVDPDNPRKLRFEDNTPLYWFGGKYINFKRPFGKPDMLPLSYPERLDNDLYLEYVKQYIEEIAAMGLNGLLLKIQVLPLEYDLESMDLQHLDYLDQTLQHANIHGINVQLNLFDTWGKRKQDVPWDSRNPRSVHDLLLEPWKPDTYIAETEFYLRYIVSRYAAYSNIHWELWNEAEVLDVSAKEATKLYVPIIRKYDPYDLLIGSSEIYTGTYPGDLTFPHGSSKVTPDVWDYTHNKTLSDANGYANGRPLIWNELKPYSGPSEQDRYDWFRACFWGNLTAGCVGSSDLCWTDIRSVPDQITVYHGILAGFLSQVIDINSFEPADHMIALSTGTGWMCANSGKEYIAFIFYQNTRLQQEIKLYVPKGIYYYQFFNPKNGEWYGERDIRDFGHDGWKKFSTPVYDEDLVLYLVEQNFSHITTPVELNTFSARQIEDEVILKWQTLSESANYGFNLQRTLDSENFESIAFIPGYGTTETPQNYSYTDHPRENKTYYYRLEQIDLNGDKQQGETISIRFKIKQETNLFPNPFSSTLSAKFHLSTEAEIKLSIFNILGQELTSKTWIFQGPGTHQVKWDGLDQKGLTVPAGIYLYSITNTSRNQKLYSGKVIKLKTP